MKGKDVRLYSIIDKPTVRSFIDGKARKSYGTAKSYRDGLKRLADYIAEKYPKYDIETIIPPLIKRKIDVYPFLDAYVTYLKNSGLADGSAKLFVAAARSFLQYADVEISEGKFKHRVSMPDNRKEDEYALDAKEIRKILQHIYNRRLKAFCLVMASCGCRPVEGLAIRYRDIDFSVQPTKIYMRAEYAKNKLPREIYISTEATAELKLWIAKKYKNKKPQPDDLIFAVEKEATPTGIYSNVSNLFRDVLRTIEFDDRKENVKNRRKITLYSFRRHVKTLTEDLAGHSFSEYILGHKKSPYYVKKEPERRAMYKEKCLTALTYLDYEPLEQHGRNLEAQQEQSKAQIENLQQKITELEQKKEIDKREIFLEVLTEINDRLNKQAEDYRNSPEGKAKAKRSAEINKNLPEGIRKALKIDDSEE